MNVSENSTESETNESEMRARLEWEIADDATRAAAEEEWAKLSPDDQAELLYQRDLDLM